MAVRRETKETEESLDYPEWRVSRVAKVNPAWMACRVQPDYLVLQDLRVSQRISMVTHR